MGILITKGTLVAVLAAALAACTPTSQGPATVSGGQQSADTAKEEFTGLPLPQWLAGFRRMTTERRGSVSITSYANGRATIDVTTVSRTVADGANSADVEMEFNRGMVALYHWSEALGGNRTGVPHLPRLGLRPTARCPVGGLDWYCGGFKLIRPTTPAIVAHYTRGYKGRPVLITAKTEPGMEPDVQTFVEFFSQQMAQGR